MPNHPTQRSGRSSPGKLTKQLVQQAQGWTQADSFYEELIREKLIIEILNKFLDKGRDEDIEHVLDALDESQIDASTLILEQVHHLCQFVQVEHESQTLDCLMMAAPVLAWTRYSVPGIALRPEQIDYLVAGLETSVLAPGVKALCMPRMYSPVELPLSYPRTKALLRGLVQSRVLGKRATLPLQDFPEGVSLLADPRLLVFLAVAPQDQPMFRWLADPSVTRQECLAQWQAHSRELFANLLAGCQFETLLPNTFLTSAHEADEKIRPLGIKASLDWLHNAMDVPMSELRATIMGFGDHEEIREYRIGYTTKGSHDVLFGTVWPVFLPDDSLPEHQSDDTNFEQMLTALKSTGIGDVRVIDTVAPREYCSDCNAPLFPNPRGEVVHAEMPDEAFDAPQHFH